MPSSHPERLLLLTDWTPATPAVLDTIREHAARGPIELHIVMPNPAPAEWHLLHPQQRDGVAEAERVLAEALPRVEAAAGKAVTGTVSIRHDPMDAIEETLRDEVFDEIILAMTGHGVSQWLHIDLPRRVAHLGLPVTTVTADQRVAAGV
ncbi:MAG: hypothetical protein QOJ12_3277 [Thermoleophilales bacterium]|jgi:hypothetical protein|nr:hypothetical protein [Thermoleophilales bacterium]